MIRITRRRFLAVGAAGGAALALAGGYAWMRGRRASPEIRRLDADALAIIRAIV
ncbi:MAG: twin-arginine translocation signal domain-containing protein, partial [Betaproteobacteria bacterium PRO3]|nr:twin-arginine translocation signal domain-containing protein [Betaproteobacteria bacterium PRO3]